MSAKLSGAAAAEAAANADRLELSPGECEIGDRVESRAAKIIDIFLAAFHNLVGEIQEGSGGPAMTFLGGRLCAVASICWVPQSSSA